MATATENFSMTPTDEGVYSTPAKIHLRPCSVAKVRVILRLRPFLSQEISSRNGNPIPCVALKESDSSSDEVTVLLKDQDTRFVFVSVRRCNSFAFLNFFEFWISYLTRAIVFL